MNGLVYHGPGQRAWETVPDRRIEQPTDAIVRIDTSTICGTDLHILKGDVPTVKPGTILGHEAVGTIVEVGAAVTTVKPGDRVLVSCITSCGRCRFCKEGHPGQCTGGGGWIFGHLIDGLQAEYARVPFADNSVYKVPDALSDEQRSPRPDDLRHPPVLARGHDGCVRNVRRRGIHRCAEGRARGQRPPFPPGRPYRRRPRRDPRMSVTS